MHFHAGPVDGYHLARSVVQVEHFALRHHVLALFWCAYATKKPSVTILILTRVDLARAIAREPYCSRMNMIRFGPQAQRRKYHSGGFTQHLSKYLYRNLGLPRHYTNDKCYASADKGHMECVLDTADKSMYYHLV